ncbi:MAG TPA: glutamate-1-semialdehyde 2,1-aminomutase [Myxococcaceae bacterium]|nr:glutamate-1-semialdehyde 2,1-aminomutase [Myxococcaceae bacterium]
MERPQSHALFERAKNLMPGGVNSPVRAFRGVGGEPVFFRKGEGAWLTCVDGHRYVDYVGSWGPLILGHAHPAVIDAVTAAAQHGTSFGAPHPGEVELAALMRELVPSLERVRLTSSGTEATMAALRLARGATGRKLILKFEGCYHGASDSLLVKAGSGVETLGLPDSPGVPPELAKLTLTAPFNDLGAAEAIFHQHGDALAAVIIEPVVGNMGVLVPRPGYLQGLQALCRKHGTIFILDEVMTGFRLALGGAQALYGITPDLTTFGKVIGGGLPVGAYGGRADLMARIAPEGSIYQAGTLSGNPLAVAAGAACLREIRKGGVLERLEATSRSVAEGIAAEAKAAGVPLTVNRVGSMFTAFFTEGPVFDAASARKSDTARFGRFFHALLDRGVYLPPSQYEAAFVSLAHGEAEVAHTLDAVRAAFRALA